MVFVTGASSGIGLATAKAFAALGAKVAVNGRNVEVLERLASEIGAIACPADVLDEEAINGAVAHAVSELGSIDVLVNCAGVLVGGAAQETTTACWDANFN